jgi:hypothetical protein
MAKEDLREIKRKLETADDYLRSAGQDTERVKDKGGTERIRKVRKDLDKVREHFNMPE